MQIVSDNNEAEMEMMRLLQEEKNAMEKEKLNQSAILNEKEQLLMQYEEEKDMANKKLDAVREKAYNDMVEQNDNIRKEEMEMMRVLEENKSMTDSERQQHKIALNKKEKLLMRYEEEISFTKKKLNDVKENTYKDMIQLNDKIRKEEMEMMQVLEENKALLDNERQQRKTALSEKDKIFAKYMEEKKFKKETNFSMKHLDDMREWSNRDMMTLKEENKRLRKTEPEIQIAQLVAKSKPLNHLPTRPKNYLKNDKNISSPRYAHLPTRPDRKKKKNNRNAYNQTNRQLHYNANNKNMQSLSFRDKKAAEAEQYLRRKYEERENRPVGTGKNKYDWERIPSGDWSRFN
jgi:hypothetical protein